MLELEISPESKRWSIARWIPSLTLVLAAVLKILNFPFLVEGEGLLSNPAILYVAIFAEIAFAISIFALPLPLSWALTLALFLVLAIIATVAYVSGTDCNCFGHQMPSWLSIVVDFVVIAICLLFRPKPMQLTWTVSANVLCLAVCCGLVGAGAASASSRSAQKEDPLAFLLADELIGEDWPIGKAHHESLAELSKGNWLVLVVREDCEHCRAAVSRYFSDPERTLENERTAVFVAGSNRWPFEFDRVSMEPNGGRVVSWTDSEPFVASPAVFRLSGGKVIAAADGQQTDAMLESLLVDNASPPLNGH